jgi:hypothetical protein
MVLVEEEVFATEFFFVRSLLPAGFLEVGFLEPDLSPCRLLCPEPLFASDWLPADDSSLRCSSLRCSPDFCADGFWVLEGRRFLG